MPPATAPRWDVLFPARTATPSRHGPGIWTSPLCSEQVWDAARATTGLEYTLKSLRSYAGSNLVAAGADVASAQELLGHLSLATTLAFNVRVARGVRGDRQRQAISADKSLTMPERLDALWSVFVDRYGDPLDGAE